LGCEIDGRGEEDAVFEVWQEEVQFESISADKTAAVFGVEEVAKAAGVAPMQRCGTNGPASWTTLSRVRDTV
jgi:hypothetical protein